MLYFDRDIVTTRPFSFAEGSGSADTGLTRVLMPKTAAPDERLRMAARRETGRDIMACPIWIRLLNNALTVLHTITADSAPRQTGFVAGGRKATATDKVPGGHFVALRASQGEVLGSPPRPSGSRPKEGSGCFEPRGPARAQTADRALVTLVLGF